MKIARFTWPFVAFFALSPKSFAATAPVEVESIWQYDEPAPLGDDKSRFSGSLDVGNQTLAGSTELRSQKESGSLRYFDGLNEAVENASLQDLKTSDKDPVRVVKSYTGYDRFIGTRLWGFVLNEYEFNELRNLKFSLTSGGGLKVDILRNSFWKLNVGAAYLMRSQKTKKDISDTNRLISYRGKFGVNLGELEMSTTATYQPVIADSHYLWSSDTGLKVNITKLLYMRVSYLYRYDSQPLDPTVRTWDAEETVQIGVTL